MTDIGIASLTDFQAQTVDGSHRTVPERLDQVIELAERADRLGLHHIGIGEHHSADFVVSSPAVVLGAIARRTEQIRLTSSVTTLTVHDPVRIYQDFATLDLLSGGRAEITVGRSAFVEPFALFGVDLANYDEAFQEKLDLLLRIRNTERVTWAGRYRDRLDDAAVTPRAVQTRLPVWVGVGGSPASATRAGQLGLPMILAYIGGPVDRLVALRDLYRSAGQDAGHESSLRLGVAVHYFGADSDAAAAATYPYYRDFLRPKRPNGSGFLVDRVAFDAGLAPDGHLLVGTSEYVVDKLGRLVERVRPDRVQALVDWGGLPAPAVAESVERLAIEIVPELARSPQAATGPKAGHRAPVVAGTRPSAAVAGSQAEKPAAL